MLLQRDAAAEGFDWRHLDELWEKLAEEVEELKAAAGEGEARVRDELGDLLFMAVNLARHLNVDPVRALREANDKFCRRYGHVRANRRHWPPPGDPRLLEVMESFWQEAKRLGL
jgi:uncharacterized protein YabN with tetrapyrrole methylase and pyrophosphatase domain